MRISELDSESLSRDDVDMLLFHRMNDDGADGDCIFVFGSKRSMLYRFPQAVRLYREKRAPLLLFSGGVRWEGQPDVEAAMMKAEAVRLGIPETDILIETKSRHTLENVLFSSDVLERHIGLAHIRRILIVTTAYHMRRCLLTLKTYMPPSIEYTYCPVDDKDTKRDNWFKSEAGRTRAIDECRKLITYVSKGQLTDYEIEP
ncbi:YdcF family protein [Paenibacillus ginsengarvi]|uniref:YdcF family protein n=1 Tax=Paenibacillus ginsengarvi TaxID=400777 RepID=A0A3B0BLT3_9BACL|nr:YdcF family protein [Paenibacillus ginsengarvi]RKN73009.1 YdcF family protein [Paenibacillus ginsengarvi]